MHPNHKVCLIRHPPKVDEAMDFVSSPHCGATSIFLGTTRISENDNEANRPVSHLYYEAYEEMALTVIENIVQETLSKADRLHRVYVCHRLGEVKLGESSILIAISSPHRASGHQMVMQILNQIKQNVPIWKKVCYFANDNTLRSNWSDHSEAFWLNRETDVNTK